VNFYKHHLGDYDGATAHLSWDEDHAYTRLLRVYYRLEKPLPLDPAAINRLVRAVTAKQRSAVDRVLSEFFDQREDGWHNKRADEEIHAYQKQRSVNREVGLLGGRPKKTESVSENNPSGLGNLTEPKPNDNPNHKPLTTNHTPLPPSGEFLSFWSEWPKNERKQSKGKCWELWKRFGLDAVAGDIRTHVERLKAGDGWRNGFVPAPLVYLNQRRWEGAEFQAPDNRRFAAPG
jgi:uncharacterized protein YdaU (DUF1376 family)